MPREIDRWVEEGRFANRSEAVGWNPADHAPGSVSEMGILRGLASLRDHVPKLFVTILKKLVGLTMRTLLDFSRLRGCLSPEMT